MSQKITKTNFTAMLAERLDLSKAKAAETLDHVLAEITLQLEQGNSITFSGFGTLSVKERAERTGRNPQTGQTITIPANKTPHFKAGKELKETVNKLNI